MHSLFTPEELAEISEAARILEEASQKCEHNLLANGDSTRKRHIVERLLTSEGSQKFQERLEEIAVECSSVERIIAQEGWEKYNERRTALMNEGARVERSAM